MPKRVEKWAMNKLLAVSDPDRPILSAAFLNSTFRILRRMAERFSKPLQETGRNLDGLHAGPGHG